MRSFEDWYKEAKNTKDDGFTSQDFFNGGWESRQTEVDKAQAQTLSALKTSEQNAELAKEVLRERDELQRRNKMLNDNVKEQGQKLVYQNEVIETQAENLLGLRDEKAELQKRVDACDRIIKKWSKDAEYADQIAQEDFVQNTLQGCIDDLEQALKGGSNGS